MSYKNVVVEQIEFTHYRATEEYPDQVMTMKTIAYGGFNISAKGGGTVCDLRLSVTEDVGGECITYETWASANAYCSDRDAYCKATGRKISFLRAIASLKDKYINGETPVFGERVDFPTELLIIDYVYEAKKENAMSAKKSGSRVRRLEVT